jgi:hypothetical protein
MILFMGLYCLNIKTFCYLISKRDLKGGKLPNFHIFGRHTDYNVFTTWNSKTRQMSKIQWIHQYSVQQFTKSSKILCPHLLSIYTCSTFLCRHAVDVLCFALHSHLLFTLIPKPYIWFIKDHSLNSLI